MLISSHLDYENSVTRERCIRYGLRQPRAWKDFRPPRGYHTRRAGNDIVRWFPRIDPHPMCP